MRADDDEHEIEVESEAEELIVMAMMAIGGWLMACLLGSQAL